MHDILFTIGIVVIVTAAVIGSTKMQAGRKK